MMMNPRPDLPSITLGDGEEAHVDDAVRIGNGAVLWTIVRFDVALHEVTLRDDLTGRMRRAKTVRLVLSAHECPSA